MYLPAPNSLLSSRSQPLDTISIDSPLSPAEVMEKLRARGKEWRQSALPEDLRKFKIEKLAVKTEGSEFEISWQGDTNPLYNPVSFGKVESRGSGSQIKAGFKLNRRTIIAFVVLPLAMVAIGLSRHPDTVWVMISAFMLISVSIILVRKRTEEPMRTRLIEVLDAAAKPGTPLSK